MQEQWTRWEPIEGLARKYYVESIIENSDEEFRIVLSEQFNVKNQVHIVFKNSIVHRYTDKNLRQTTIDMLNAQYGKDFYENWTFFKVTNSAYIKWLTDETEGIYEFKQCSLIATDAILDIITGLKPEMTFVNLP